MRYLLILCLASLVTFQLRADSYDLISFDDFDDTIYIDIIESIVDDTLWVDFDVRSFDNIESIQFTIGYSEGLEFEGIFNQAIEPEINPNIEGRIPLSWIPFLTQAVSLDDGTNLFRLKFIIKNTQDAIISIVNDPVEIEITTLNQELVQLITDPLTIPFSGNLISGFIYADQNSNCIMDDGEDPLSGWIIKFEENEKTTYLKSDHDGRFRKFVNDGNFSLFLQSKNELWSLCETQIDVIFESEDNLNFDFEVGAMPLANCPAPIVSAATPRLRRCFSNTFYFEYCNDGTVSMDSSEIHINFPGELEFLNTQADIQESSGGLLVINGGSLEIGECKTFKVNFQVDCDNTILGQTLCLSTNIYPNYNCVPNENWTGANVEVYGECEGDQVKFTVKNTGTGDMSALKSFIVIEDDVMLPELEKDYDLAVGDSVLTYYPGNGKTYRLIAQQEDDHPFPNSPTIAIEGCGTNENGDYSTGFVTQFEESDNAPFVDALCMEIVGSYDPNDKQGFPKGYGDEFFIYKSTDLEYLIRFQNTGSDTAFTVVIEDELLPELNPFSLQVGPASHDYQWSLKDERTLVFEFDNILLPDSATDLEGSQGFIKIKVKQEPGNEEGLIITNDANIFFDFNEPILTNQTLHTIGNSFIVSEILEQGQEEQHMIKIYPNPAQNGIWIERNENDFPAIIKIYDNSGRLVNTGKLENFLNYIERSKLSTGVNYLVIVTEEGKTYQGKVILLD